MKSRPLYLILAILLLVLLVPGPANTLSRGINTIGQGSSQPDTHLEVTVVPGETAWEQLEELEPVPEEESISMDELDGFDELDLEI